MECLHFLYTSQATYAMDKNGLYFGRLTFFIFEELFFVGVPKTTQNQQLKLQIWGLCYTWVHFADNETSSYFQDY